VLILCFRQQSAGNKQRCSQSISTRLSVCLFHTHSSKNGAFWSYGYGTLTGNPTLEVQSIDKRDVWPSEMAKPSSWPKNYVFNTLKTKRDAGIAMVTTGTKRE